MSVVQYKNLKPNTPLNSVVMLDKFMFVCGFGDDRIVSTKGKDVLLYHANYARGAADKDQKLKRTGFYFITTAKGKSNVLQDTSGTPRYACAAQEHTDG